MNKIFTEILATATLSSVLLASPVVAQLKPWEDFETSESVWQLTTVNLKPGTLGLYLEGLKKTWVEANKISKQLGHIEDYAIYANQNPEGEDFDLLLVIEMAKTEDLAPNKDRYYEFMKAWGEENQEQSNETVIELYNEIRELSGSAIVREITIK